MPTAFSTALSGKGIAGTSGGGTSEPTGTAGCCAGTEAQPATSAAAATHKISLTASTLAGQSRHHASIAAELTS
ncbi:hypothetical protein GCM10010409_14960 [Mycolicibacterium diernhoferi]